MNWVQFSRVYPEEGADWLAYWRERGTPRPEVEFTADDDYTTRAREVGDPGRRWVHYFTDICWREEGKE